MEEKDFKTQVENAIRDIISGIEANDTDKNSTSVGEIGLTLNLPNNLGVANLTVNVNYKK